MVAEDIAVVVVVREYNEKTDSDAVVDAESRCDAGTAGKLSLYTHLMGDPLCRVRHSPAYLMLVAEMEILGGREDKQRKEIVGMIRGCLKMVTLNGKLPENDKHAGVQRTPATKIGYILGLRVSPSHRRMGIGLKLVRRMELWLRENGAQFSYIATENDNTPSLKLFTTRCGYSKFRTPSILVQPVFAHRIKPHKKVTIIRLTQNDAVSLYWSRFSAVEFFPSDIDVVLNNKLTLGTFVAVPKRSYDQNSWPGTAAFLAAPPASWAVMSIWNCKDVFRLEVRGASRLQKAVAKTTRVMDRAFPWLQLPSVPKLFGPFGLHFLYGLGGEGPNVNALIKALCDLAHNMAQDHGCGVLVTEVAQHDPIKAGIPHWEMLSCDEDVWCIKSLGESLKDLMKSPPLTSLFVDPREF